MIILATSLSRMSMGFGQIDHELNQNQTMSIEEKNGVRVSVFFLAREVQEPHLAVYNRVLE